MTYKKAILDVELFDVEDLITTSGGSGVVPVSPKPEAPPTPPEPSPTPQPAPPMPESGDGGDEASN